MAKNVMKRNGIYYLRAMVNGKRYYRSLGTSDKMIAMQKARDFLAAAKLQRFDILDTTKVKKDLATIGEIFARFREKAAVRGVREKTIQGYVSALRSILSWVYGEKANVEVMSCDVLTATLVDKYATRMIEEAKKRAGNEDRTRRSVKSTLRQARSLFSRRWAFAIYQDVKLPDLSGFMGAEGCQSVSVTYYVPPKELRERTITEGRALKQKNPALYAVFLLCYDLGMRAGEAAAAEWSWITADGGLPQMNIIKRPDWKPKGRERSVPIDKKTYEELKSLKCGSFILPGATLNERSNLVKRDCAQWMRELGWDRETYPKAAHELRKMIGSRWYTEISAETAQTWLGHKDIATTCRFYGTLDRQPAALKRLD